MMIIIQNKGMNLTTGLVRLHKMVAVDMVIFHDTEQFLGRCIGECSCSRQYPPKFKMADSEDTGTGIYERVVFIICIQNPVVSIRSGCKIQNSD